MNTNKPRWPSTFVEALSWREARKILDGVRSYVPEDVGPSEWPMLFWILLAIVMQGS